MIMTMKLIIIITTTALFLLAYPSLSSRMAEAKVYKGQLPPEALYKFEALATLDEGNLDLSELRGKTVLVTNVASKCGYTDDNYKKLSELHATLPPSFVILAFPSNEFMSQEPGSAREIRSFLTQNYQIPTRSRFKIMQKTNVNGKNQHPFIKLLKLATDSHDVDVKWNFETKFIIAPDGIHVERHTGAYDAMKLKKSIEKLMGGEGRLQPNEL